MTRRRRESGLTLTEVIVAAALALIGFLVALVLYQAARQAFRKGELAADQQQETRVGFDRMMRDLRLGGYNWNATGEDRVGEEQIEGAWTAALTVRGDYDFEDGTLSRDPEDVIAGSTNKATVGNDEIVTYFLGKDADGDGTREGGTTVTFAADVDASTTVSSTLYGTVAVRDSVAETVSIPNVATTQDSPPYNLYRATLNNADSSFGSAAFVQPQLLSSNIRSLAFTYKDQNGAALTAPGGGETATDKDNRARIRKINVAIVGMTAVADRTYTDPTDPAAPHYRKFNLTSEVTPRNLGFRGRADQDLSPPSIPTGFGVCAGHCTAILAKWNANPSSEGVVQYDIKYGLNATSLTSQVTSSVTTSYIEGLTSGTVYYFAVRAVDASGNRSGWTNTASATVQDATYPSHTVPDWPALGSFTGTGHGSSTGLDGRINLSWAALTVNEVALSCDPGGAILRDLQGYRLYRSESSSSTPTGTPHKNETVLPVAATSYADTEVINCRTYYYYLTGVDKAACGNESSSSAANAWLAAYDAKASSVIPPAAPTGVFAERAGLSTAIVSWQAVTQDTDTPPHSITIEIYHLWRVVLPTGSDPEAATYSLLTTVTGGGTTFTDTSVPTASDAQQVYYKVSALDDCPNESEKSAASELQCAFNGAVSIAPQSSPPSLQSVPQIVTVTASGTDTFVSATLTIEKAGGSVEAGFPQTVVQTGNGWSFNWTPSQGAGTYLATAIVTNSIGCAATQVNQWDVILASCVSCVTIPRLDPFSPDTTQQNRVVNSCAFALQMTTLQVREKSPTTCTHPACLSPMTLTEITYDPGTGTFTSAWTGSEVVSTTSTASVTFATPLLLNGTTTARIRLVFASAVPIWHGSRSQQNRMHTLEGNFNFEQTSSLCSPASTGFLKLEITP